MKEIILYILNKYLNLFPEEKERQSKLEKYLSEFEDKQIIDWNNFKGHIVASGLIYSKKEINEKAKHIYFKYGFTEAIDYGKGDEFDPTEYTLYLKR